MGSGAGRTRNQEPQGTEVSGIPEQDKRDAQRITYPPYIGPSPIPTSEILQERRVPWEPKESPVVTVPRVTVPKPPVITGPSVATGGPLNTPILTKVKTMDLGSLLGKSIDAYGQYQLAKMQTPTSSFFGYDVEADVPFVDVVKKPTRRRRRRRLATTTDIRDLAALANTVGKGEAFKTWIATHPSY